jgi:elongation factor G
VALTGCKLTATGDTLCERAAPIVLESMDFPAPVMALVIEPSSSADRDKLKAALVRLAHEDPTFHVNEDADTGQWLIAGMGELHLEVLRHRLENDFHVSARVGKPRVAYREAVLSPAVAASKVERILGGKEIHGAVELEVLPDPDYPSARVEWGSSAPIAAELRQAVLESLALEAHTGPRFGFPLIEARVRVRATTSDPRRDSPVAFTQAAAAALREALAKSDVALVEPVMAFEIQCPAEFGSGIIADLNSRRAEVAEVTSDGPFRTVRGSVPLSAMFGYSTAVRSLSQGRASFSMSPGRLPTRPRARPRDARTDLALKTRAIARGRRERARVSVDAWLGHAIVLGPFVPARAARSSVPSPHDCPPRPRQRSHSRRRSRPDRGGARSQ